jgi:hypothetical protein
VVSLLAVADERGRSQPAEAGHRISLRKEAQCLFARRTPGTLTSSMMKAEFSIGAPLSPVISRARLRTGSARFSRARAAGCDLKSETACR